MRNQRGLNVAYYAKNRDAEILRVTTRQRQTVAWLRELRKVPCLDCGGTFPPHVMDFDHRDPNTKSFQLTTGRALLKNRKDLMEEIGKCDIVCANCHHIRTARAYAEGILEFGFKPATHPAKNHTAQGRRARFLRHRAAQMEVLDRIRTLPCADCARTFPPCVMEFDHRDPTIKRATLSVMAGRVRVATFLEEIAKCDIVCANCHRDRTYRRRAMTVDTSGCGVMEACDPSKVEARVRFPPPAPEQQTLMEEAPTAYRSAA